MDYINKWLTPINTLVIIGLFIAVLAGGGETVIIKSDNDRSAGQTRVSGMNIGASGLNVSGASTFATTTDTSSYDGFMIGGSFDVSATGTVKTLYTHSEGVAICNTAIGDLYADSTAFSPSLVMSVGTSTSAIASTNLIASTTIATTTDSYVPNDSLTAIFRMTAGDVITGITGDITNTSASSTYYGNWDVEYQVFCRTIGG
jgi:hypothetical protein